MRKINNLEKGMKVYCPWIVKADGPQSGNIQRIRRRSKYAVNFEGKDTLGWVLTNGSTIYPENYVIYALGPGETLEDVVTDVLSKATWRKWMVVMERKQYKKIKLWN